MSDDVAKDPEINLSEEEKNKLLRVDPYALRDVDQKLQERTDEVVGLNTKFQNERDIEDILRQRSEKVLADKCNLGDFNVSEEFFKYCQSIGGYEQKPASTNS